MTNYGRRPKLCHGRTTRFVKLQNDHFIDGVLLVSGKSSEYSANSRIRPFCIFFPTFLPQMYISANIFLNNLQKRAPDLQFLEREHVTEP